MAAITTPSIKYKVNQIQFKYFSMTILYAMLQYNKLLNNVDKDIYWLNDEKF